VQHLPVHPSCQGVLSLSRSLRLIQYRARICRAAFVVQRAARVVESAGARAHGAAGTNGAPPETGQTGREMRALPGSRLRERHVHWSPEAVVDALLVVLVSVVAALKSRTARFRSLKAPFGAGFSLKARWKSLGRWKLSTWVTAMTRSLTLQWCVSLTQTLQRWHWNRSMHAR